MGRFVSDVYGSLDGSSFAVEGWSLSTSVGVCVYACAAHEEGALFDLCDAGDVELGIRAGAACADALGFREGG